MITGCPVRCDSPSQSHHRRSRTPEDHPPASVESLLAIIRRLHQPDGCPWCLEQTTATLKNDLLKESYEVADAIDRNDAAALGAELGDLLFVLLTHIYLGQQAGAFTFDDVVTQTGNKIVRRHPHVYGDAEVASAEAVLRQWDAIKREERSADASILEGVPRAMPALMRADEIQRRAARVGFDWPEVAGVIEKLHEEVDELARTTTPAEQVDELGDLLFALVNLARHRVTSAEDALQAATDKFTRRFQVIEQLCRDQGHKPEELSLDELEALWQQAKQRDPEPR
jgi:MazG family protein